MIGFGVGFFAGVWGGVWSEFDEVILLSFLFFVDLRRKGRVLRRRGKRVWGARN
jgi:hypothetical protein